MRSAGAATAEAGISARPSESGGLLSGIASDAAPCAQVRLGMTATTGAGFSARASESRGLFSGIASDAARLPE